MSHHCLVTTTGCISKDANCHFHMVMIKDPARWQPLYLSLFILQCGDGKEQAQAVLVHKLLVTVQSELAEIRPQDTPGLFSSVLATGRFQRVLFSG